MRVTQERGEVDGDCGDSAQNRHAADAAELVNCNQPGEKGFVADFHIAAEGCSNNHDDIVADFAVVCDMRVRHQEAAVTDHRFGAFMGGAVDGHAFAEAVVAADFCVGDGTVESVIFGVGADGGEGVDEVVFAHSGVAADERVCHEAGSGADFHIVLNDAVGPDHHIIRELRGGIDNSGRMNLCHSLFLIV